MFKMLCKQWWPNAGPKKFYHRLKTPHPVSGHACALDEGSRSLSAQWFKTSDHAWWL